MSLVSDM